MSPEEVNRAFGNLDLYLFDQILKNNFKARHKILDAGCGEGRNLKYFVNNGFDVYGVDNFPAAINMAKMLYKNAEFKEASIEEQPYPDTHFDAIICINVLHHSTDKAHFLKVLNSQLNMLKEGGLIFIRTLVSDKSDFIQKDNMCLAPIEGLKSIFKQRAMKEVEPIKQEVFKGNSLGVLVFSKKVKS